ncbi:hypothetical protein FSARC_9140 [Fusarium sarcochroum]|uniref:Uncharacterized protein n=1 Tax=Fusarium sarcochroum TaxID=1208366 RepID=A0A8H4TRV6_9HYPO|nr:hypothetical protein FSARC_9140 [Fusarium sarcochroum]
MCETKIWHRKCTSCSEVETVEYLDHNACKESHASDEKCTTVATTCPDESLEDTNSKYVCRSCRSDMYNRNVELQLKIMEERQQKNKENEGENNE